MKITGNQFEDQRIEDVERVKAVQFRNLFAQWCARCDRLNEKYGAQFTALARIKIDQLEREE